LIRKLSAALVCWCTTICIAQQVPSALPDNYKVVLTEPFAKVIRVHYGPHEKVPVHDHPSTPTVYVYLNDSGPVRLTHFEEKPFSLVRPPTHKGAFRVSPGRIERHSVENLSDLPSDFLRVELPGFQLGEEDLEFRGKAPDDLTHDLSATEFAIPRLSIARTICVDATPCAIRASAAPSIVVAFSHAILSEARGPAQKRTELKPGDVLAVSAGNALSLSAVGNEAAHILQISVQSATPVPR
jgi:quercetin dioxygenase-like cupin family protein